MSDLHDKVQENSQRLTMIEGRLGKIEVDVGKMAVTVEHENKNQTERYENISTQTFELKELMKERMKRDEEREKEAREYREQRELSEREAQLSRQKWMQSVFTPQTVIIILAMILSLFGLRMADVAGMTGFSSEASSATETKENP